MTPQTTVRVGAPSWPPVLPAAGLAGLAATSTPGRRERAGHRVFRHGVASGDPQPHAVLIWTRVTPTAAATPGSGKGPKVTVALGGRHATAVPQGRPPRRVRAPARAATTPSRST